MACVLLPSINMSEFLMHKQTTHAQKRKELKKPVNNAFGLYQKGTQFLRVCIMGPGQMIGEEDVIKERTYTMSARCFSTCAKLYYMKSEDFHR